MTVPRPRISVIVPNYNGAGVLAGCLDSLARQDHPAFEVIVVDDASTDRSPDLVAGYPGFALVRLPRNLGFAPACNTGVNAARGDLVALVNSDTVLPADFLSALEKVLAQEPRCAVVAPRIENADGDPGLAVRNGTLSVTGTLIFNVFADPRKIFGASGAALLYRRGDLGLPFDPDYRFFHEDTYLSWRARLAGWNVRQVPEIVVRHLGSVALKRTGHRHAWLMERNRWLNALTFWSAGTGLRLWPLWLLSLAAETIRDLARPRVLAARLRAWLWLAGHPFKILRKRRGLQSGRRAPDREILPWFTSRLTNSAGIGGRLLNALGQCWCRLMRLRTCEL